MHQQLIINCDAQGVKRELVSKFLSSLAITRSG
jgi:hypothetical protein